MPRAVSRRTTAAAVLAAVLSVPLSALPAQAATPDATAVTPSSRAQGSSPTALTVTGTNLESGATVDLGSGITVTYSAGGSTANLTGTSLTGIQITVAPDALVGPRNVTVTNPGGSTDVCSACFTVTAAPTITSVTPSAGNPGQTVNVTIEGSGFQSSPTVSAGPGITVSNVVRVDSTTITATLAIAANAATGPRTVTVTHPDGSTASRANAFTVGTAITVTGVSPSSRGRGAQNQTVAITGSGFTAGATVAFSGTGVTVDSATVVSPTRIDAVVDVAAAAALGQRNVTVTNPGGITATCTACFAVTAGPTVTATAPNSARVGQTADITVTGTGFLAGATVSFGAGITVGAVTVSSSTSLVARVTVAPDAAVGTRAVTVTNPDGGTGACASCFSVLAGRVLTLELVDTRGTATTADDVVTTRPVSGTTYTVRVTARQSSAATAPVDTTYTGTPTLSSGDTTFTAGTCTAAVNGVSTCTGVRFGDLGPTTLVARGAGADSDRIGSLAVVVQPTGLVFTAAPTTGETGQALTYTVAPQAGVAGAKIAGYAATRTLQVTGTGSSIANGTALTCSTATCTFTLAFSTAGTKTVAVTDNSTPSRSTPVVTVEIAEGVTRGTYTPLVPARVLDTRTGNDGDGFSTPIGRGGVIDVQLTGRGGVPATGVAAVVVNATAVTPTGDGFVTLFPTGTARPTASTLNFLPGQVVANLAVVKVGTGGRMSAYNLRGDTHLLLDVVGWYSTTPATTGGRTIAVTPARILDTRPDTDDVSTPVGPGSAITRQVLGVGGVPAGGVSAVVVNVTAVRATARTFVTAYPSGTALPGASTLNVDPTYRIAGRVPEAVPNLAIVKVGNDGRIALYNHGGTVDLVLDVVGFVSATSEATAGRFVALAPTRVLDTRAAGDGDAFAAAIGPDSAIDLPIAGRGGVPATGATAVLINVTAISPTASTYLTVYPAGETRPTASNVNAVPTQIVPNLVLVKLGPNGAGIYNRSGSTHVAADVVGYFTG